MNCVFVNHTETQFLVVNELWSKRADGTPIWVDAHFAAFVWLISTIRLVGFDFEIPFTLESHRMVVEMARGTNLSGVENPHIS